MIIFADKFIPVEGIYFNLSSYICYNGVIDMTVLMPSRNIIDRYVDVREGVDTEEFDNLYANEIISNQAKFSMIINIMNLLHDNPDTNIIILIEDKPYRNSIKLSLIRFIQSRYGYPCYCLDSDYTVEDLQFIMSQHPDFSYAGSMNLINDNLYLLNNMDIVQERIAEVENSSKKENWYATQRGRLPLPSETI